jgi:hypothetical protein
MDKDQIFFVKELRKANLGLVKNNPQSSGIKISMQVSSLCTLVDKVQELKFWSSGIEHNAPHTQRYELLYPKFIPLFDTWKTRKSIM